MTHARRRRTLLGSAAMLALAPAGARAQAVAAGPQAVDVATAQTAQGSQQASAPADARTAQADEAKGNEIVVTGSRIARKEFAAPNPIVSFNAAAIQESGNTNITNFLQRVPALTGSRDSTQTAGGNANASNPFGAAGLNELNLRNLGTNRTLVLVNGRRHVAGEPSTAAVDINSIPTDLVERVDVLTGGASAVYGADGVSGVVNFILKRDFDGFSARSQFGISGYGDAPNRFASAIVGRNFADGRGNVTLAYEYNFDGRVGNDDRPFLRQDQRKYLVPNDAYQNGNGQPQKLLVGDLRYSNESFLGAVFVGGESDASFDGLGRPYDNGTPASYYRTGGVGSAVAGFYSGDLLPRIERNDANLLAHYDFSDAFKLSVEGKFAQTKAHTFDYIQGTYYYPIPITNPFVPTSIYNAAVTAGADTVYVNRDNLDYGRHGEDDLRRTYRGVVDASGRISEHATWDAYYEYGRTDVRITKLNDRLSDPFTQALDAVRGTDGRIVCASGAAGCLPVSLFGPGPLTRDQAAFFTVDDVSHASITQQVANASISGDFGQFFKLPGGPVQFSLGGEYRRESSRFSPSDNLLNARFFQYDEPSLVLGTAGHFDVKEVFGELNAPILTDVPFASTLSVGAAGRYSHYSTVGNTKTWQFNGIYAPIRDISFRGSYGKAVRAPNIGELFQPTSGDSEFFIDPCTPANITANGVSRYRAANCAASLAKIGAVPNEGLQTSSNVLGTASGNPDLKAETARTWTAGIVLRPRFLRGLTASFDWYNIKLTDAINRAAGSQLASLCVDQPTLNNPYCSAIVRSAQADPANGVKLGQIVGFTLQPENVAAFRTAGADINVDYLFHTTAAGTFDLRLVGGYLHRLSFINVPGAPVSVRDNLFGAPRWTFNFSPTWTLGGLTLNYNFRWTNRVRLTTDGGDPAPDDYATPNLLHFSSLHQHDVQAQYRLPSGFAFYGGINNFTNQKPDAGNAINVPISPLGRYFYVGAKINLDRSRGG